MRAVWCLLLGLAVHGTAMAAPARDGSLPAAQHQKRDPFTTSDRMYAEQAMRSSLRQGNAGFVPGMMQGQGLPKMRLRGYATNPGRQATALLDIDGAGVYMVRRGDEIGLHAIGLNTVLKVVDVSSNGVKVQSGQVNQVVIVR